MCDAFKILLACENQTHDDIELQNGIPVVIGRGPQTKIKDKKLSKNQVNLIADYQRQVIKVKQLGPNPSTVNGQQLLLDSECELKHGDIICLLYDKYPHKCCIIGKLKNDSTNINRIVTAEAQTSAYKNPKGSTTKSNTKRPICDTESDKSLTKKGKFSGTRIKIEESVDIKEEDEDEHLKQTNEQLDEMRRLLKRASPPANFMKRSTSQPLSPSLNGMSGATKFGMLKAPGDQWDYRDKLIVYTCKGSIPRERIAGFDIDWTIIGTKTGKVFPAGPDDWRILFPEVLSKLRQLFEDDYKIVFFSNQRGFSKDNVAFSNFKNKIQNVIAKIGVPVQVYISIGSGIYRKPAPGMWEYLEEVGNEGYAIDLDKSFYVGDAAGRPANCLPGKKKKDFSCSDRLFALNIGLKFYTPEEFFLGQRAANFSLPEFDPRNLKSSDPLYLPSNSQLTSSQQEVIIMVGYPASGKSHFALNHIVPHGYVHISRDILGSWQKCVGKTEEAVRSGKSVIIDNTNADAATRKRYIDCARVAGVPCRCFVMTVNKDHSKHNNKFRHIVGVDQAHEHVNDIVLNAFKAKYEEPKMMEGFKEIVSINFVPDFRVEREDKLYHMFLQ